MSRNRLSRREVLRGAVRLGAALSRLSATARRAIAAQAAGADAAGTDWLDALVASLLAVWAWLESTRPSTRSGGVSADEYRSGALAGGVGCGDDVS